jgi:hypothetical protein
MVAIFWRPETKVRGVDGFSKFSKIALRAELERLVAQCDGPINRKNDRVTVRCAVCPARRMVSTQYLLRFGVTCLRCGSKMRLA